MVLVRSRDAVLAAALAAALGGITGCAGTDGAATGRSTPSPTGTAASGTAPSGTATSSTGPSTPASGGPPAGVPSGTASPVPALALPETGPGLVRLGSGGPRRGNADLGPVAVGGGTVWVNVDCVADSGSRPLTVTVGEVAEFRFACGSAGPDRYANRLDLSGSGAGRLHVKAPRDVRWVVDVQGEATDRR